MKNLQLPWILTNGNCSLVLAVARSARKIKAAEEANQQNAQDAPGGYVNFGRTLPGWDKFRVNKSFGDKPWLFENFDQLSFLVVDEEEFERIYSHFQAGKYQFDITQTEFDVQE